ncbi:WD40-repeat-containing domain protein [Infundibulicybe gibba]|nr:WD40-repeat-containing domain protein [Infundibulicybe gibba]
MNTMEKHISVPAHGSSVITCLLISHDRIISSSDDHTIQIHALETGELLHTLQGHDGGVWSMGVHNGTLVTGSTDRTVRVWDIETGRCSHIFRGHTSTVRCLAIVQPEMVDVEGSTHKEKWPKRTLFVTGSRDHSLRVWTFPRPGEEEYRNTDEESDINVDDNPYHRLHLEGHDHAVRALAAQGCTIVSGSFDCTVRVWDIITGSCEWVLTGHTQKVYVVQLDITRKRAYSGSMDSTVRIWDLETGQCRHELTRHTYLVGLIELSPSYLVSGAADGTLCAWDPDTGELKQVFAGHPGNAVTFAERRRGGMKMWDMRTGVVEREFLIGTTGVWQVAFKGRWCVAASNSPDGKTALDIWEFGAEGGWWAEEETLSMMPPGDITEEEDPMASHIRRIEG